VAAQLGTDPQLTKWALIKLFKRGIVMMSGRGYKIYRRANKVAEQFLTAGIGDCYEAAGKLVMDRGILGPDKKLILVHGEVMGQGPLEGVQFGHAWVLDGSTVLDYSNNRRLEQPKSVYYAIGRILEIGNWHHYTVNQMRKKILQYQHWGPWDLETSTGL